MDTDQKMICENPRKSVLSSFRRPTIFSIPGTEFGDRESLGLCLLVMTVTPACFRKMTFSPCMPCGNDLLSSSAPVRQQWEGTDLLSPLTWLLASSVLVRASWLGAHG
jgi:hypothetical protein